MKDLARTRWEQIDALYAAALERPAGERLAFARAASAGDDELYRDVVALLEIDREAERILGDTAVEFIAPLLPELQERLAAADRPARVGPYRILEEIGRGGMGRVYLAERDDPYRRRVALKLVKRGMDSEEILRRFRYERQILAALEHPYIARLYDGGVTEDGRPYLAMEYVAGEPIDRYCDAHRLDVTARLYLFIRVAEAVQHAHGKLVVHRDLKPSNIVVTAEGQVKLLDFGIAKLLGEDLDGLSVPLTRTGMRMMTLEYAAPEQVRGEPVTTATDVYALGVILYELLTGRRPYDLGGRAPGEAERIVLEQEPERPSTCVTRPEERTRRDGTRVAVTPEAVARDRGATAERLRRRLRGDLDTILLTALQKDPGRRYPSVESLLDDLRRHLDGRPVAARPDSVWYRAGKFVRRHRWGTGVSVAFVLLMLGSTAAVAWQLRIAQRERDVAQREQRKAEAVTLFMRDLFKAADPHQAQGDTLTARELLDRGAARADTLRDQPEVQAALLGLLGDVYLELAQYDRAEPLYRQALALRRQLHGEEHPDVAKSLNNLGVLYFRTQDFDSARVYLERSVPIQQRTLGAEHPDVLRGLSNLGYLASRTGDTTGAERRYREVLAIERRVLGEEHPQVAKSLNNLAAVLFDQGRGEEAAELLRQSLTLRRRLLGPDHPDVALSMGNLAAVLLDLGEVDEAERLQRAALALREKLFGAVHPSVAASAYNLGRVLHALERYDEAEALYRRAAAIEAQVLGERHPEVGRSRYRLALLLLDRGDPAAAEAVFRDVLSIFEAALPSHDPRIAVAQGGIGASLTAMGRYAEAEPLLLASFAALERDPRHTYAQQTIAYLVALYDAWGRPEQAARYRPLLQPAE